MSGVCCQVECRPAVSAGQAGVSSASYQQANNVQIAGDGRGLDRSVAILVYKIDINIFAVTTKQVLKFDEVTVPESIVEFCLFVLVKMFMCCVWNGFGISVGLRH